MPYMFFCCSLFFFLFMRNKRKTTETAPLITLDLSQLKRQGVEHRDDQINYVYHSSVQGKPINHIQVLITLYNHGKYFFF